MWQIRLQNLISAWMHAHRQMVAVWIRRNSSTLSEPMVPRSTPLYQHTDTPTSSEQRCNKPVSTTKTLQCWPNRGFIVEQYKCRAEQLRMHFWSLNFDFIQVSERVFAVARFIDSFKETTQKVSSPLLPVTILGLFACVCMWIYTRIIWVFLNEADSPESFNPKYKSMRYDFFLTMDVCTFRATDGSLNN